jgi:diguanylate cyclase (GGDEF)-like protein
MRILVVDDSEDWRDLTEAALLSAGYEEVHTAASATHAYAFLGLNGRPDDRTHVDLIVLDVVMPQIDGIEACARVRSDARYADIPIVMVTAINDMDCLANAFVAGATDYITKPFNRVELLARVRSALKLKAELDRRKAREAELMTFARMQFDSRDPSRVIDAATGLFAGEAAEAYLSAAAEHEEGETLSVLAVCVDRLDAMSVAHGEDTRRAVLAQVAHAIRQTTAPIGVVAAAYGDGVILVVVPKMKISAAQDLAESLRQSVVRLAIANSESIAFDGVTASVGVVSGQAHRNINRAKFVADARAVARRAAVAGGNRVAIAELVS